jgi:nitroreductase
MPTLPLSPDELLTTTRTVRKRLDLTRPVPLDVIRECLEVALQAPSGSNRQGWRWMVITDEKSRRVIGDYYRQSVASYLNSSGSAAALFEDDPARNAVQRRVGESVVYLGEHMGEVPVLVIPCISAPGLSREPGWLVGIPASSGMELHAGGSRAQIGYGVDNTAPAIREGDLRTPGNAARYPAGRAHPHRLLHRRHVPGCTAATTRRGATHQFLVIKSWR